jgi:hypothetical protein
MKSFVDNFDDKRISIQTLERMLSVNYQRDTLLELVIDNYENQKFELKIGDQYFLKLENLEHTIFILISSKEETLERVQKEVSLSESNSTVIVFDKTDKFNCLNNKVYVCTKEWMNRIISHGINRQILDLQYLRDMEYYHV